MSRWISVKRCQLVQQVNALGSTILMRSFSGGVESCFFEQNGLQVKVHKSQMIADRHAKKSMCLLKRNTDSGYHKLARPGDKVWHQSGSGEGRGKCKEIRSRSWSQKTFLQYVTFWQPAPIIPIMINLRLQDCVAGLAEQKKVRIAGRSSTDAAKAIWRPTVLGEVHVLFAGVKLSSAITSYSTRFQMISIFKRLKNATLVIFKFPGWQDITSLNLRLMEVLSELVAGEWTGAWRKTYIFTLHVYYPL